MFKEKKYQVIKNAISYELANFVFNYQLLRRQAVAYMYEGNYTSEYGHYGKRNRFKFNANILLYESI